MPLLLQRFALPIWVGLLVLIGTATANAQAARRVALLIGNAAYQHERPLKNPVNDAELLARVLQSDLKFDEVRVERNLTVDAMDRAIEAFAQRAKGADSVFFYYSGHGQKSGDRRNFLLPVDARTGADNAPRLDRQAISAEDIRDKLKAAGARVTVVVLDACRDGPGGGKSGNKGLARMGGGNGLLVAYATEEDRVAADGTGANSPYAQAMATALKRTDLPLLAQFDLVADEVRKTQPGQEPTREGNLRADAYLISPFGRTNPQQQARLEDEAWALCRNAATAGPCQALLDDYPQGQYARLARTRRDDLQARQALPAPVPQPAPNPAPATLQAGQMFKDCDACPQMVVIPAGSFTMGSSPAEQALAKSTGVPDNILNRENPQHAVSVRSFAAGKYAVSKGEFATFVQAKSYQTEAEKGDGCFGWTGTDWKKDKAYNWRKVGFAQGNDHPVVCVSWNDTQAYIQWLNQTSGKTFRLLSEAEREYATRAGTRTAFWWGDSINTSQANYSGEGAPYNGGTTGQYRQATVAVSSFNANPFGLYNVHGNVWEWTEDCFHDNYSGAPVDGSAWTTSCKDTSRVLRGGSWLIYPAVLRSAYRDRYTPGLRDFVIGFRLARTVF
jgi:formylglycine-generating enzyme required for sulfatase activity/uncharacterized caspase-like protein